MNAKVTPVRNLGQNAALSASIALVPTALTYFFLSRAADWVSMPAALVAFGIATPALINSSEDVIIQPRYTGVMTVLGIPTPILCTAGTHKRLRGLQGIIPVYTAQNSYDPGSVEQLAGDDVPIYVDGFFFAKITDPYLWVTEGGPDKERDLIELFEAQIRLFVAPWKTAASLIGMRNLLGDFLKLPANGSASPEARALRAKFDELTDPAREGGAVLTTKSVDDIWDNVGKFKRRAAEWGYQIIDVHTEDLDLPPELKAAAMKRAAEPDLMEDTKIRIKAMREMIDGLVASSVDANVANNTVAMLLKLPVTKNITEIHIGDLANIVDKVTKNPELSAALVAVFTNFLNNNQGKKR